MHLEQLAPEHAEIIKRRCAKAIDTKGAIDIGSILQIIMAILAALGPIINPPKPATIFSLAPEHQATLHEHCPDCLGANGAIDIGKIISVLVALLSALAPFLTPTPAPGK